MGLLLKARGGYFEKLLLLLFLRNGKNTKTKSYSATTAPIIYKILAAAVSFYLP